MNKDSELLKYAKWFERIGKRGSKPNSDFGICFNFASNFNEPLCDDWWPKAIKSWKFYSGNKSYPVSAPDNSSAVDFYYSVDNLWAGKYGAKRRALCRHVAKYLRNLDKKAKKS